MSQEVISMNEVSNKEQEARKLVTRKARLSSIAAALPIPFLDMGTDMKLMNDITDDIEEVFGLSHEKVSGTKDDLTLRAVVMGTSMGSEFIVKRITPFISKKVKNNKLRKFRVIDIIGTVIGAVISYILMKKLGDKHVDRCVQYLKEQNAL